MRWLIFTGTHIFMLAAGFALGVYLLPILTAPPGPDKAMLAQTSGAAVFKTEFKRGLKGNDFLHWGEGAVSLTPRKIVHEGKLAPGPDYRVYLLKEFAEDEAQFLNQKDTAQLVGPVKTFDGFLVDIPSEIDINQYSTVLVWCEAFGEFITAAKYK